MEHYYASQMFASTIIEEHTPLFAHQQDTVTVVVTEVAAEDRTPPVYINPNDHPLIQKVHKCIVPEHPTTTDIEALIQKALLPDNYWLSVVIPQAQPATCSNLPMFLDGCVCTPEN